MAPLVLFISKKIPAKSKNTMELTVRYTGIGIPEAKLKKIFERFYSVESSRSKETGGYVLGLAMAKEIAEQHKAVIKAESVRGRELNLRWCLSELQK